jgi:intraflagellar transport protein 81
MVVTVDQVKYVVSELNARLGKKLNVISYDNLRNEQRIEILLQVFQDIDPSVSKPFCKRKSISCKDIHMNSNPQVNPSSFEVSDPEEVVVTILEMLRIFKYRPPEQVTASDFRQGIIECDKDILTHIMVYLFDKQEDLKKRAYLAKYLVRIEVSPEVEGDNDIVQLYEQVSLVRFS